MCGFIGQITGTEQEKGDLLRGLPWIQRRGPDSQCVWLSADRLIGLLHAQLAIVDRSPQARQPLSDVRTGVTVGFTGEIYNHLELRAQFPEYPFSTDSDTEIIIAAYATHGINGLSLLKGPFSMVIIDEKRKKIILARDPIGKKPLFFAKWEKRLLFGTSLLPLAAITGGHVNLNKDALPYFWGHSHINPGTTALSGGAPVLPGEVLEFDWSGSLLSKSSCQPKPLRVYEGESLEEVIENTRSLLALSVKRRLCNNPDPMVFLSGGIDSTVVTYLLKEECEKANLFSSPEALTLASLVPFMNDEFYAIYAARRLKVRLKRVNLAINIHKLGDLIIQAFDLQDEPLGMPSFFLLERLVTAMSRHSRLILTGDGGDEVFIGYGKPDDWRDKEAIRIKGESISNVSCGPEVPLWMSTWARKTVTDTLVGHMFAKADRASAEHGVELRCPLLDWDLVSYARSLPFEVLVHGERTKALLKDQLRDWPHWFLERPKLGFAYNLRWLWGLSCYKGLRECVDRRAVDAFEQYLPYGFHRNPVDWKNADIFQNFEITWRLLAWSRFLLRLDKIRTA